MASIIFLSYESTSPEIELTTLPSISEKIFILWLITALSMIKGDASSQRTYVLYNLYLL
jgi:hypothetical protein